MSIQVSGMNNPNYTWSKIGINVPWVEKKKAVHFNLLNILFGTHGNESLRNVDCEWVLISVS